MASDRIMINRCNRDFRKTATIGTATGGNFPYETLYLRECAQAGKKVSINWA